jgi:Spy/CpxP family protein refolding chaperone
MLRNFAIALTTVAVLALAANVQAQQGQGRRGTGGGMGGGMMMGGMLLQNEKVQKELDLTAEQKEKLQEVNKENRDAFGSLRDLSQEERMTKMREMGEKAQKKVEGILLPNQVKRLKEIQLQAQGTMALANPDVAKELGLTDDQKEKIKTINQESRGNRPQFTPGQRPSQEERDKMQKAREETNKKIMDVLTADQKSKLETMKGEKFDTAGLMGGGMGGGQRRNRGGNNPAPVN